MLLAHRSRCTSQDRHVGARPQMESLAAPSESSLQAADPAHEKRRASHQWMTNRWELQSAPPCTTKAPLACHPGSATSKGEAEAARYPHGGFESPPPARAIPPPPGPPPPPAITRSHPRCRLSGWGRASCPRCALKGAASADPGAIAAKWIAHPTASPHATGFCPPDAKMGRICDLGGVPTSKLRRHA